MKKGEVYRLPGVLQTFSDQMGQRKKAFATSLIHQVLSGTLNSFYDYMHAMSMVRD